MALLTRFVCDGCGTIAEGPVGGAPGGWVIRRWHPGVITPPYPVPEGRDLHACPNCRERVNHLAEKMQRERDEAHRIGRGRL